MLCQRRGGPAFQFHQFQIRRCRSRPRVSQRLGVTLRDRCRDAPPDARHLGLPSGGPWFATRSDDELNVDGTVEGHPRVVFGARSRGRARAAAGPAASPNQRAPGLWWVCGRRVDRLRPHVSSDHAVRAVAAEFDPHRRAALDAGRAVVGLPARRAARPHPHRGARRLAAGHGRASVRDQLQRGGTGGRRRPPVQRCACPLRHAAPRGGLHWRRRLLRAVRAPRSWMPQW